MTGRLRKALEIQLLGPLVTSSSAATAADPEALPYVPGAMLWGALAASLYTAGHDRAELFHLLHSGALAIGDGWPLVKGGIGLPVPLSLHVPKGADGFLDHAEDWSEGAPSAGYAQRKRRAVGPGLFEVPVGRQSTLRTAISPETGRADDGQLFSFEALAPDQTFVALIEGDEDAVGHALGILTGVDLMGRSRSAEFGRVAIRATEAPALPGTGSGEARFLWCLSDLLAHDPHGLPTTRPGDDFFGAAIDWSHSFLRRRTWSPFNAAWGSRAAERQAIERGSVIVLEKPGLAAGLHRFGFHQEQGLGLVVALTEPPLAMLRQWQVAPQAAGRPEKTTEKHDPLPDTALTAFLRAYCDDTRKVRAQAAHSDDDVKAWMGHYMTAAAIAGRRVGPTPSQWGAVAQAVDPYAFLHTIAIDTSEAEAGSWHARIATGEDGRFVDRALAFAPTSGGATPHDVRRLRLLARNLRRELDTRRWFDAR